MSINNKIKRTQKKRQKAKKRAFYKKHESTNIKSSLSSPVFTEFDNPFKNLTEEERKVVINEIGKNSKNKFEECLNNLQLILKTYNPIILLSIIAGYGLSVGGGENGIQSKENSPYILSQSHVEILQALILQISEHEWGSDLVTPDIVQKVWEILIELSKSFYFMRMNGEILEANEKDKSITSIQEQIRGITQSVRNWGYYSQVLTISTELYSYFDEIMLNEFGFTATNSITIFNFMLRSMEKSLTERYINLKKLRKIKKPKELIFKYCELVGQSQKEAEYFSQLVENKRLSVKSLFIMLLSQYSLSIQDCFYFTSEFISENCEIDLEHTKAALDYFSYNIGDLQDKKTEFLFLDNPVWHKPIIKRYDEYFCAMPQLFFSFIIPSLDELVEKTKQKNQPKNRKSFYLEEKIEEIVKRRFPESLTVSGVEWYLNGVRYETDLITFIDSYAIIIEAKSHKISKPALRGGIDRIKRHVEEVLIEPSIQSKRLENRLNELRLDETIEDELRNKLPINLNTIHKILRVSVCLEDFASLQASFSQFSNTGWLPEDFYPCPTMNLADFETVFDYLEHPIQIIHYLQRRNELEGYVDFVSNELHYLGLYTTTLFNFSDIDLDNSNKIMLIEMSSLLDNYYSSKSEGIIIDKPRPKISKLFSDIFVKLENRSIPRWSEIGVLLNYFSPDDQEKLVLAIKVLERGVNRTWKKEGHKNIIIYKPPESSEYALAYVLFKNENSNRRYEFINSAVAFALEPVHIKKCLVIAKNIDSNNSPYDYIGFFCSTK